MVRMVAKPITKQQKAKMKSLPIRYEAEMKSLLEQNGVSLKPYPGGENEYNNHFRQTIKNLAPFFEAYGGVALPLLEANLRLRGLNLVLDIKVVEKSEYSYSPGKPSVRCDYSSIKYGIVVLDSRTNKSVFAENLLSYNEITGFVPNERRAPATIDQVADNAIRAIENLGKPFVSSSVPFEGGFWGWHSRE